VAVSHNGLNVTAAAKQLFTSQPGVSRQVRLLEDELGFSLFVRQGKALVALTHAGKEVLRRAERILKEVENIKAFSHELTNDRHGQLNIATTHTQARYALPKTIENFIERYPDVSLHMHQGTPMQISELAADGTVDFAIATEGRKEERIIVNSLTNIILGNHS